MYTMIMSEKCKSWPIRIEFKRKCLQLKLSNSKHTACKQNSLWLTAMVD